MVGWLVRLQRSEDENGGVGEEVEVPNLEMLFFRMNRIWKRKRGKNTVTG